MGIPRIRALAVASAVAVTVSLADRLDAIEFFDGRLEIHGFYEAQVRAIARDYSLSDGLDLTQWYNTLNIEAEVDSASMAWTLRCFPGLHACRRPLRLRVDARLWHLLFGGRLRRSRQEAARAAQ